MARSPASSDPLTTAAAALADELRTFEGLGESLRKEPLTSQKSLQRAAELLTSAADADNRLGASARGLVEAVEKARLRQVAVTEAIQVRAREVQGRAETFQSLMRQYEVLGQLAAQTNHAVQAVAGAAKAEDQRDVATAVPGLLAGLDAAIQSAQGVVDAADREGFADVTRSADSLRQQMLSARNKMNLLLQKLPPLA